MTTLKDKLTEAINNKNNDVNTFVWKFPRKADRTQEEIKLIDATPEQLQSFYDHCKLMLYNQDKINPGRYVLLDIIKEQRTKCNVELFLRKLETGEICGDGRPYPRRIYIQDLRAYIHANRAAFPTSEWKNISIAACTNGVPREFERISIEEVLNGGLDMLGTLDTKHITFNFILNLGVFLTPQEMAELNEKDKDGNTRSKLEVIKERLGINPNVRLTVKQTGLNYTQLRALVNLRSKKYSELTTAQLNVLLDKVLFKLEDEVQYHINQWETHISRIKKVCELKGITLKD